MVGNAHPVHDGLQPRKDTAGGFRLVRIDWRQDIHDVCLIDPGSDQREGIQPERSDPLVGVVCVADGWDDLFLMIAFLNRIPALSGSATEILCVDWDLIEANRTSLR